MVARRSFGVSGRFAVVALACLVGAEGRADRIVLRGGVQLKGVVVPGGGRPDQVAVLTEVLANPIKYRKDLVVEVIAEPTPLTEYLDRRGRSASTAEGQYELGLWCEGKKLSALAGVHYRRAVERDGSFGPAHKKLGHVLYDGRWLTADELRAAQGLVKHKGRWVSKEQKERRDAEAAATAEQRNWARRLAILRDKLLYGKDEQRREAEGQLAAIADPSAVVPLVRAFGGEGEPLRLLLVQALGAISGREAAAALVGRLLAEEDPTVRQATMRELARREEPTVVPQLAQALRSADPRVVNRAAWGLGNLGAVAAVPKLIPALVLVDQRYVWDGTEPSAAGGGLGVGFGGVGTGVGLSYGAGSFGSGTTAPLAMLTPPAVAPGAVAFGATGFNSFPGDGLGPSLAPYPSRTPPPDINDVYRNAEVLAALEKLTGRNFGFDVEAWQRWLRTSFRPDPAPARSVPQP